MTTAAGPERLTTIAPALRDAATRFGTPVFVTDISELHAAADTLADAFPDPWQRRYSVKANDVAAIVGRLAGRGMGANVVSSGEWAIARRGGLANDAITLEGIGKTDADLRAAVRAAAEGAPLAWVAVESKDELDRLIAIADVAGLGRRGRRPLEVLVRSNPDVNPETHAGLAVGAGTSKFGMTETELTEAVERAAATTSLQPRGIHLHVGSQLGAIDAWRDAVRRCLALVGLLRGGLPAFDTLDVGGGFPVGPAAAVPSPERFVREIPALLDDIPADRRPERWAVEPGRYLVARSGWLVASVLHVRDRGDTPLVVLDTGMTELIRPALYGAGHRIVALTSLGAPIDAPGQLAAAPTRVDGPICESTDALGVHHLPPLRRGDLVGIADAGAYATAMSSTYNGRPRAAQVFLEPDGRLTLARRRGSVAALG